jgi:uncharacterized membrane protein
MSAGIGQSGHHRPLHLMIAGLIVVACKLQLLRYCKREWASLKPMNDLFRSIISLSLICFEASHTGIISTIISRTCNPYCFWALWTMSVELSMALILPYPLAIRASKLNHVNTSAVNAIYQNLSILHWFYWKLSSAVVIPCWEIRWWRNATFDVC